MLQLSGWMPVRFRVGVAYILDNQRIYCNPIKITDPRVCSVNWEIYLG